MADLLLNWFEFTQTIWSFININVIKATESTPVKQEVNHTVFSGFGNATHRGHASVETTNSELGAGKVKRGAQI